MHHIVDVYHPTNVATVFGTLRSRVTKSTDEGHAFTWFNDGYSTINCREIAFNSHNPNALAVAFQDYRGYFSTNAAINPGNPTWTIMNPDPLLWNSSGAYAFSPLNMFVGVSDGWDATFKLYRTENGGVNWTDTGKTVTPGSSNQYQRGAYGDPHASFQTYAYWYHYRTTDSGVTWNAMTGVTVVFAHDHDSKALYGAYGASVVKSTNHGSSWQTVCTLPLEFTQVLDVAYDHDNGRERLYITGEDSQSTGAGQSANLFKYDASGLVDITNSLPEDPIRPGKAACTVAVDRNNPLIVYVGRNWINNACHASVYRSTDAGANWTILTPQPGTTYSDFGGRGTYRIRVHPTTRDAWVGTFNYGLWRFPYPTP